MSLIKFQDNSNMIISGCSSCGKTTFVKKLILGSEDMYVTPPSKVLFIYSHWQPMYDELERAIHNIEFVNTLPNEPELREKFAHVKHGLLIADDKLTEINKSDFGSNLFTRLSHHLNISTVLLLQNATLKGKAASDISKSCHYNVLMRSPRDCNFIRSLGTALRDYKNLQSAYSDATQKPYSYLIVSTHPKSDANLRYYTQIFPEDPHAIIYLDKAQASNKFSLGSGSNMNGS